METRGGDVLALVNENINCSEIQTYHTNNFETLGIKIKDTTIISAYVQQNGINSDILDGLFAAGSKLIVIGDLNSRCTSWNCKTSNTNGCRLYNYINSKSFVLLAPVNYTPYPTNSDCNPSTIDIALIKNINLIKIDTVNELDSDNLPIIIEFNANITLNEPQTYLNYSKADWNKFKTHIDKNFKVNDKLKSKKDVDKAIKNLTLIIQKAINTSITKTKFIRNNKIQDKNILWIIKVKNRLRR